MSRFRIRRKQLHARVAGGKAEPVIILSGEADIATAAHLDIVIARQLAAGARRLTIEVSGLKFADAAALHVLVDAARTLRQRGGRLVLMHPKARVAKTLRIVDKDQVITVSERAHGRRPADALARASFVGKNR